MSKPLIPRGWKSGFFTDLVSPVREKQLPSPKDELTPCINLEDMAEASGRLVSWSPAGRNLSVKTVFKKGDILFGKLRPYLRKYAQAPFDGVCTTEILAFRANQGIDPEFAFQVTSSEEFVEHNVAASYGTKMPRTDWKTAASFPVLLPPLPEQRRIAELLSTLNEEIAHTDLLAEKQVAVGRGLFVEMLSATEGYERIGEHFHLHSGTTPLRSQARFYAAEGVPWVKTLDLNESELWVTDERVTAAAISSCSLRVYPRGTVLVAMYGGWEQIGRTALLAIEACTNQALTALVPKIPREWEPYFVLKALQALRHKWTDFAVSTRKDPNITKSDIAAFLLPKLDVWEQRIWADRLRTIDSVIAGERAAVNKLRLKKQGLMNDLLTGHVRFS
jgi:type I restriction enzyme, S subunit